MNSPKFRASYTILNTWLSDWERAVKYYFKLETFATREMVDGREWHEKWATHIQNTKTLPIEFNGQLLKEPICEKKIVVQLAEWLDLVGIIDCYDKPTIYEFKTGKQSSEEYAGGAQAGVYGVLATYAGLYTKKAEIHRYDQYMHFADMSVVWLTDKRLNDAYNWIITIAGEMHSYFMQQNLYERFGGNLLPKK